VEEAANKLCEIGRRAYARGLVSGSEGNFSARLDGDRVLCTPSGLCKGLLAPGDLCVVDLEGKQLGGRRRPSSEVLLHLAIYAGDPGLRAVVHAHPPFVTTFSVLGESIPDGVLPEGEVFLGPVPLVPYETPGTPEIGAAVRAYVRDHVAAILQNHGTVTWARDLETAYVLTETLEAVARVVFQARLIGQPRSIPAEKLAELAGIRQRLRADPPVERPGGTP
jgi:L-fuculose-phosphate aldolase